MLQVGVVVDADAATAARAIVGVHVVIVAVDAHVWRGDDKLGLVQVSRLWRQLSVVLFSLLFSLLLSLLLSVGRFVAVRG